MTQLKLEGFAIFFSQHRCLSNKIKTNLITEMTMNEENKAADSLVFLWSKFQNFEEAVQVS